MRRIFSLFIAVMVIAGCASGPGDYSAADSGVELGNFDTSIRPQDDFFSYVNGTWLAKTEIPADRSNYGSFTVLAEESQRRLRIIIEESAAMDQVPGSEGQKVGDFYNSFLDTEAVEAKGLSPLEDALAAIAMVNGRDDLMKLIIDLEINGISDPIGIFVSQDAKDAQNYALYVNQGGLGLPDRDYYFKEEERFQEIRQAYLDYIEALLALAGQDNSAAKAGTIMAIEKSLAGHHWSRTENRNRDKTYNKRTIDELSAVTPNFDWPAFLQGIGAGAVTSAIVRQPSYLDGFNTVYGAVPVADWKAYMTFKLLHSAAPFLSAEFVEARFNFTGRTIQGIAENSPRWKRGVNLIGGTLGEAVGKIYVERYFPPEAKRRMVLLVDNLKQGFLDRLEGLEWMGSETKVEARAKLNSFNAKIGYPDVWRDYSDLEIDPADLMGNVVRASQFGHWRKINRLGGPIDRNEWAMTPQTVNAYYSSTMNEIVFPAAILQEPFFNLAADDAVNYGGIGAVIGHEISHGFDDQGRKSDGNGNLREWWTAEDEAEFERRADVMVAQYNSYNPIDSLRVNGRLTLGENIGDLGGMIIAHTAYRASLNGAEAPVLDGLTGDQRFLIGWAQIWRRLYRDDELRRRLVIDSHSPSQYRVNGIVSNMELFYEAFDVQPGDGMYIPPAERVRIW